MKSEVIGHKLQALIDGKYGDVSAIDTNIIRRAIDELVHQYDAIGRLTRERGELAKKLEAIQKGLQDNGCEVWEDTEGNLWVRNLRAEGGEAKLSAAREELAVRKILIADAEADVDAARAELAECRNKALDEAKKAALDYGADETAGHSNRAVQHNTALGIAHAIDTLKEAPHG